MTSSMLESQPVFESRLRTVGLPDNLIQRLTAAGINSMGSLAFICTATPGQGDDSSLFEALDPVMGFDADNMMPAAIKSMMRRMWFEASAAALADVKSRVDRTEDSQPKRLPLPERESRRAKQQAMLSGLVLEGPLEPSHGLVDLFYSMKEEEILRYVEPAVCVSRQQELLGSKKESFMKLDSNGRLVNVQKDVPLETDLSSEYRVRLALQRRSLALDQIGLLTYAESERYHDYLYKLMLKEVPDTHQSVSMKQIMEADKLVWLHMAEQCRSGISVRPDGTLPMSGALSSALSDPIILSQLTPLPKSKSFSQAPSHDNRRQTFDDYRSRSRDKRPFQEYQNSFGKGKKGRGKGKGKAYGKNRYSKNSYNLPGGLTGSSKTKNGDPICFNYNLAGCSGATPGRRCEKGVHICCRCFSNEHTYQTCDKK